MNLGFVSYNSASGPSYTTWNPADKGSAIALSGGNLTMSASGVGLVRAVLGKSSGKWYWEVTAASATTNMVIGVADASAAVNGFTGQDAHGWGLYGGGGVLHVHAYVGTGFTPYSSGDIIGCALDMNAQTIQFYKNGSVEGSLITGLSATMFPSAGDGLSGVTVIANFGASAFAYTPPAGFNHGVY